MFSGSRRCRSRTLFKVDISTRTYSLNEGEYVWHAGNAKDYIDLVAQNHIPNLNPKALELAYDTDADALVVVQKNDGTFVATVMTFVNGLKIQNNAKTRNYRQAFITMSGTTLVSGTAAVSGTAVLSGTDIISGSVAGPVQISYNTLDQITAYRWNGDFQYNIPGDMDTLDRIVHGKFTLGSVILTKSTPP